MMIEKVSLLDRMTGIREAVAANLREYRRRLGLTQEQFAEKANVSTHYIAMIETCNTFPKPEMLERLAEALGIEPLQLFGAPTVLNEALERLLQQGMSDMKQVVREAVKESFFEECRSKGTI
jgi:transcriptional regulator with XRE-family HTH domain